MAMMNYRYIAPENLIDINRIAALAEITEEGGNLRIGAMVRQRDAQDSPLLRARAPLLPKAARLARPAQTGITLSCIAVVALRKSGSPRAILALTW